MYNIDDDFRKFHPRDFTTLPGALKSAGALSLGSGKTFHNHFGSLYDGVQSWSREALPYRNPCWTQGVQCVPCHRQDFKSNVTNDWCEIEALDDKLTVDVAIELYESWQKTAPFYLAVGLHKPRSGWQ